MASYEVDNSVQPRPVERPCPGEQRFRFDGPLFVVTDVFWRCARCSGDVSCRFTNTSVRRARQCTKNGREPLTCPTKCPVPGVRAWPDGRFPTRPLCSRALAGLPANTAPVPKKRPTRPANRPANRLARLLASLPENRGRSRANPQRAAMPPTAALPTRPCRQRLPGHHLPKQGLPEKRRPARQPPPVPAVLPAPPRVGQAPVPIPRPPAVRAPLPTARAGHEMNPALFPAVQEPCND